MKNETKKITYSLKELKLFQNILQELHTYIITRDKNH